MIPEIVSRKWRNRVCRVSYETAGGVGVNTEKERNKQMVGIPERFEGLLPDTMVRSCIH